MEDYILNITDPALLNNQMATLMPAGENSESYLQKLARIDYQDNKNYLRDSLCTMLWGFTNNYQSRLYTCRCQGRIS